MFSRLSSQISSLDLQSPGSSYAAFPHTCSGRSTIVWLEQQDSTAPFSACHLVLAHRGLLGWFLKGVCGLPCNKMSPIPCRSLKAWGIPSSTWICTYVTGNRLIQKSSCRNFQFKTLCFVVPHYDKASHQLHVFPQTRLATLNSVLHSSNLSSGNPCRFQ